ncbi:MAG: TetR/AcrR family transcriptional regulator [Jatrophihabitantaceae bacterium]
MVDGQDSAARGRGRPGYDLESLLAVVVSVFNERGYDGSSMEHLSARLGISKSAVYHHVKSKQDLLQLALNRALDGLFAVADQTRLLTTPAVDRLEYLVRGSVSVLQEQLPYVTLLLRVRGNTEIERTALDRRRKFDRYVTDLVKQAQTDGDIRTDVDATITAHLLFGTVNSIVDWYRPTPGRSPDAVADAVCAMVFDGLRVLRG